MLKNMINRILKKFLKTLLKWLNLNYIDLLPGNGFNALRYQIHNQRRQEHLASLGLDIANKSILETGAGTGDHTHFFIYRNCDIESTEPRLENIKLFKKRYPNIQIYQHDMENPYENNWDKKYDIVYCYGLLYHLKNPEIAIKFMSEKCKSTLLLETCVSYGDDESINNIDEPQSAETQSFVGVGCRPTRPWVFNTLKKYFKYVYITKTQPNHEQFPIDWKNKPQKEILSRGIFIASHIPLNNNLLSEELIDLQVKGY